MEPNHDRNIENILIAEKYEIDKSIQKLKESGMPPELMCKAMLDTQVNRFHKTIKTYRDQGESSEEILNILVGTFEMISNALHMK